MEQYWYVIKEKKHFGPFGLKDLKKLYKEKKIGHNSSLWHPKWPEPVACHDERFADWWDKNEHEETPPPRLSKKYFPANSIRHLSRLQSHNINFQQTVNIEKKHVFKVNFKDQRYWMVLCLLISTFLVQWKLDSKNYPQRPTVMAPSQYSDLKKFWNNEQQATFTASNSKDYKTLWIAQKINATITSVTLEAKSKNLISKNDYSKTWTLTQDQSPQLVSLKFDNNLLPPLGFYKLTIHWNENSYWGFNQENKINELDFTIGNQTQTNLRNLVKKFHNATDLQQTAGSPNTSTQNTNISDTSDLKQKYETLNFLIIDIKNNWLDMKNLKSKKLNKAMQDFQNRYAKSTGSFLTAMVLSNESEIKNLSRGQKTVNTKVISHLYNLTETAKKTGILSAELMSDYNNFVSNPHKSELWVNKINNLEQELLDKLKQL